MKTLIDISVPVLTFVLLAGVGLDLTVDDFRRVRRQPALMLAGLVGPLFLLPPIAVGLAWAFQPTPEVTAGLLLVAACPIGGISNTYSYMARASTALSVALTGLSCLLCGLTVPAVGRFLEMVTTQPLNLTVPIPTLITQLLLMFSLPVALGMWARRRWADRARRYQPTLQNLAFIGVGLMLVLIISERSASLSRRVTKDGSARCRVHRVLGCSRMDGGGTGDAGSARSIYVGRRVRHS